uniref:Alcohol dehydrogenase n=1 Tax=Caldilinea aerophila TaxID=133453 RepID=A0A7C1JJ84_9CHLR
MKWLHSPSPGVVEVTEVPIPALGAGEALVRMRCCGICGTDLMKVYSPAAARPAQLGHEVVGIVEEVGEGVALQPGTRVALAHHVPDFASHYTRRGSGPMDPLFKRTNLDPGGFAEFIRVPALHVQHTLLALPDNMPDLRAVFMEPLACCLRALDRVVLLEGDAALIIGVGAVGLLFAPLLADRTVTTFAVDVRTEQLALAQQWGVVQGFPADDCQAATAMRDFTQGRGVDIVILTVWTPTTLDLALRSVRDGGTLLLFGAKPDAAFPVDGWELWRREINLVTSYSATPDLFPRALAILRHSRYTLETTVSHVFALEKGAEAFYVAHKGLASKVVIACE